MLSPVWPLPICLDSWTWHSRFLCNIALYSIRPCFYPQSHPWLDVVIALAPSLHSFWSYFSTDLQEHIGHRPTWGVSLSVSYHFAFSYCSWGSQGNNTEVVCHSLLQLTMFCQNSPPWLIHLGWLYTTCLSFLELVKAVVHVIRLISFLWLWFLSVCPLMPSLHTNRLTGISLTLDVGYLFKAAPAKHSHCSLGWMCGISSWPLLLTICVCVCVCVCVKFPTRTAPLVT